jgi:hypothetical protein
MQKNYYDDKSIKKRSAVKVVWVLLGFGVLFVLLILKYALAGGGGFSAGQPTSDDAYEVAKEFVETSVKASSMDFPTSGYQFAKEPDSVYVIKSYVEAKSETGDKRKTDFTVTMKYKGGQKTNKNNWTLLDISQNQ